MMEDFNIRGNIQTARKNLENYIGNKDKFVEIRVKKQNLDND